MMGSSLGRQGEKNTGFVAMKMGLVAARKVGWVQVRFPDLSDLLTQWIPVAYQMTQATQAYWTPDIGEQVICLMDDRLEDGCVIGAVYSAADQPPTDDMDEFGVAFPDGGAVRYNRASGVATVVAPTRVVLQTPLVEASGDMHVAGTLTADVDVVGGGVSLKGHVHGGVVPGGSTTEPPA